MKTKAMITMLVSVAMILTAPLVAMGKGKPENPGSGSGGAGDAAGALYGDLYVIERDGNGVPVTRTLSYPELDEEGNPTGETTSVECNQPLAADCTMLPLWGDEGNFDPEVSDACAVSGTPADNTYFDLLQTVSFGRESVGRSPASVLDHSYLEALKTMNDAIEFKRDPAGRIMLNLPEEDDPTSFFWKTIDSPLENLGLYRALMTDGCVSPIDETTVGEGGETNTNSISLSDTAKTLLATAELNHLVCADPLPNPVTKDDMLSAAVFLGAAADKTSPITLDEIINMNTYLQINPYTYTRTGKTRTLTVTYFQFKDPDLVDTNRVHPWFAYKFGVDACDPDDPNSLATLLTYDGTSFSFSITPNVNVCGGAPHGVDLRGDNGVPITVCRGGGEITPAAVVCDDPSTNPVDGPETTDLGCGGANWFAQAAEDARKTIWYLHNYEAPALAY